MWYLWLDLSDIAPSGSKMSRCTAQNGPPYPISAFSWSIFLRVEVVIHTDHEYIATSCTAINPKRKLLHDEYSFQVLRNVDVADPHQGPSMLN